jgi:hypothetical protein
MLIIFLKFTHIDGFFDTHHHIFLGQKIVYSRRGHCEHLKLFIAFAQQVVKNLKKKLCAKKSFFCAPSQFNSRLLNENYWGPLLSTSMC